MKIPRRRIVNSPNKPKGLDTAVTPDHLRAVAEKATYSPSQYHCPDEKGRFAIRVRPATHCPDGWSTRQALNALREAILAGNVSRANVKGFPRFVWRRAGDIWYEAHTNAGTAGEYHGYPVEDSGVPGVLRNRRRI